MKDRKLLINELMQYCDSLDENCPVILLDVLDLMNADGTLIENLARLVNDLGCKLQEKKLTEKDIVRCKCCNNRGTSDCQIEELCCGWIPDDNWFCADGERKEGR